LVSNFASSRVRFALTDDLCQRADLCNSWLSQSKPRFEYFISPNSSPREQQMPEMNASMSQDDIWNARLLQILASMRSMSLSLSGPFSRTNVNVDDIYSLERRIVVLLAETNPRLNSQGVQIEAENQPTVYQISLAALAYLYLFFRDNLVHAPLFSILISRLFESLFATGTNSITSQAGTGSFLPDENNDRNNLQFWVVAVGALVATGRLERNVFVDYLRKLGRQIRVQTFDEYVQVLKRTAWIDSREDGFLWLLWSEVQGSS